MQDIAASKTLSFDVTLALEHNVFDLSGAIPFLFYVQIYRRCGTAPYPKSCGPLRVETKGTVLDIGEASRNGLFEIVPAAANQCSAQPLNVSLDFKFLYGRSGTHRHVDSIYLDAPRPASPSVRLATRRKDEPHTLVYALRTNSASKLQDGQIYRFRFYNPNRESGPPGKRENTICYIPSTEPLETRSTEASIQAILRLQGAPIFKAVSLVEMPPRFDFKLNITPTTFPVGDTAANEEDERVADDNPIQEWIGIIHVTLEATLLEPGPFVLQTRTPMEQMKCAPLPPSPLLHDHFEVVDLDSGVVLSGARPWTCTLTTGRNISGKASKGVPRSWCTEFRPGEMMRAEGIWEVEEPIGFWKSLRLEAGDLAGRRLGIRLKKREMLWRRGGIDRIANAEGRLEFTRWQIPMVISGEVQLSFDK